jgi:hypothetical protein
VGAIVNGAAGGFTWLESIGSCVGETISSFVLGARDGAGMSVTIGKRGVVTGIIGIESFGMGAEGNNGTLLLLPEATVPL